MNCACQHLTEMRGVDGRARIVSTFKACAAWQLISINIMLAAIGGILHLSNISAK